MGSRKLYAWEGVIFSCMGEKHYSNESLIVNHALIRIISGEMKLTQADRSSVFKAGDTVFVSRNQLVKVTKYPVDEQSFKSVTIYFTQKLLQKYYALHSTVPVQQEKPKIKLFNTHPLLDSLFDSMLPYFTLSEELPEDIAAIKLEEAIAILRAIDKYTDSILGHFEEPGKIQLADFMEKHYMFNMTMEKFGYLSGRSLTTFKNDFRKAFNTTPQKWLTRKRLENAHYQIFEQKRKPSDVYLEIGFENLSHFSFAFKKQFGYNATEINPLNKAI